MDKVLIIGGAGYIGSHTCLELSRRGYLPVVYDNLMAGHEWAVKWGPLYKGEVNNLHALNDVMLKEKPIAVIHFAARTSVGESVKHPDIYYDTNVLGTYQVLKAMHAAGVKHIIFSSTAAVYGEPKVSPITEDMALQPINPYGKTKLACERMIEDFCHAYDMRGIAFRYFNASGADAGLEIGEDHDPETHLIPRAIEACIGPRNQLTIFGTDYPTLDGTCIRDYIHVSDLAAAHVLGFQKLLAQENLGYRSFNLGSGQGFSVKQIVNAVEKKCGSNMNFQFGPRREGDPPSLVASGERAKEELGWELKNSDLDTIVSSAVSWYKKKMIR